MTKVAFYSSLVDAHQGLLRKGYDKNYNVIDPSKMVDGNGNTYSPYQLSIDEFYRFEGESDPADNSIIYAVSANDGSKGTLVDSYGAEGSRALAHFVLKVEEKMQNNLIKKYNYLKSNVLGGIKKEEKLLIGLAAGAILGTIVGVLLAPKGRKVSAGLVSGLKDFAGEIHKYGKNVQDLKDKYASRVN